MTFSALGKYAGPPLLLSLIVSACEAGHGTSSDAPVDADLVLTNARVYSLAWGDPDPEGAPAPDAPVADGMWTPDAEAIAIKDGVIVGVGTSADMSSLAGPDTKTRDLAGAVVVPGLVESHGHYEELGELAEEVDLVGVSTEEELLERVAARAAVIGPGEWIVPGGGPGGRIWGGGGVWGGGGGTKGNGPTIYPRMNASTTSTQILRWS